MIAWAPKSPTGVNVSRERDAQDGGRTGNGGFVVFGYGAFDERVKDLVGELAGALDGQLGDEAFASVGSGHCGSGYEAAMETEFGEDAKERADVFNGRHGEELFQSTS